MQDVGKTIIYERLLRGLTTRELAEQSGLTERGLGSIERGVVKPGKASLRSIASALGFPADHFLDPKADSGLPVRRKLVAEVDITDFGDLSESDLKKIRSAMESAARHVLDVIKGLKGEKESRE